LHGFYVGIASRSNEAGNEHLPATFCGRNEPILREDISIKKTLITVFLMASVAMYTGNASAGVTDEDLGKDQATTGDIVTNGMGRNAQRFIPIDKINRETVKKLVSAWSFSFGGEKQRGQETQPIIYDGIMYVTGSYSRMWAIDLKTGKVVWKFQTGTGIVGQPATYDIDGERCVAIVAGWGGAVPLPVGGEVAERVKFLNQGGSVWVFKLSN
jgi:outer membrane protein assembly factor BamB